jgi:integrase
MLVYYWLAMPGRQAKILSLNDVNDLLVFATCTRHPFRNRLIVLLAAKAGLRAGEIANLTWDMVLDPTGDAEGLRRVGQGADHDLVLHPAGGPARLRDLARGWRHHDRHRHPGAQLSAPHRDPGPVLRRPSLWVCVLPARRLR